MAKADSPNQKCYGLFVSLLLRRCSTNAVISLVPVVGRQ
jgi:hypothetical protein